ncbi:FMN-binding negative transcriptional regulator [Paludisphaera borealis]|uniref:FMN-binding negative transcriptional regulator n=1 Tax=Paludisphaera borealis TaxID=1387353 RepID=UPI002852BA93|nr:FMN-binding negative transcriptional regulator [Paludisphaera borealis]
MNPGVLNRVLSFGRGAGAFPRGGRASSSIWSENMFVPASFAETDTAKLHEFMRRYSFAVLTTHGADGLTANHLPLLLDAEAGPRGRLFGHMARANPQWRQAGGEALAVFSGPHAYVSPTWYEEEGTVPTWNYVAVHAYGRFQIVEDDDELLEILRRSVATYESAMPTPWSFDDSAESVRGQLKAIVGFHVEITRLEGKWKLNQNHPERRRRRVAEALESREDADSVAIAELMRQGLE